MSKLTRDGTAEPVSRDQILRRERRQVNIQFPCSADHVQDWQPYPVDPYSCFMCDHTYIHTAILHLPVARRRQKPRACPVKSPRGPAHAGCASRGTYVSSTTSTAKVTLSLNTRMVKAEVIKVPLYRFKYVNPLQGTLLYCSKLRTVHHRA